MSNQIRVIAICIFRHGDKILVFEDFEKAEGKPFYRPLGGGVKFGETTQEALKREIREETGLEVTGLKLLTILENLFMLEGKQGHEIVYVYDGQFTDKSTYKKESFEVREESETLVAKWRNLDFFDDYHRLVPREMVTLLKETR